jgi:exonuclease III
MTNNQFEILAINESRLDNNITDNLIKIQGYTIVRKDRDRHGGGVVFYIKNNIAFKVRFDLCYDDLETLTVEIEKPSQKYFLITTWYRPPSSEISIMSKFEQLLKNLEDCNKESIILGDFNCNILAKEIDTHTSTILSLYDEYQYTQLIDNPTRVTENSSTFN